MFLLLMANNCCFKRCSYFKQKVSLEQSAVKITDEVPRDNPNTINTTLWTAKLEDTFKENYNRDKKSMRYRRCNFCIYITQLHHF